MKPVCLFIDLAYRKKTNSSDFLCRLLARQYRLEYFYVDTTVLTEAEQFAPLQKKKYDLLACRQVMVSHTLLKKKVSFKKSVFFPIWETYESLGGIRQKLWREYGDTVMVCFSKKMSDELKSAGFNAKYIQYFPRVSPVSDFGDEKSLFFSPRGKALGVHQLLPLFQKQALNHLHLHKFFYGEEANELPPEKWLEKTVFTDWLEPSDYKRAVMQSAFFAAPPTVQSIGSSFLEAMAWGRVVIAPDKPPMNEYIVPYKTGVLYEAESVAPLRIANIRRLQKNTLVFMKEGFQRWEHEKNNILGWCVEAPSFNEKLLKAAQKKAVSATVLTPVKWGVYKKTKRFKQSTVSYVFGKKIPLLKVKKACLGVTRFYLFNKVPLLKTVRKEKTL